MEYVYTLILISPTEFVVRGIRVHFLVSVRMGTMPPLPTTSCSVCLCDSLFLCLQGGGTRIPFVQTLVREVCGPKPSFTLDSSACIATGAAIIASSVQASAEEAAAGGTSAGTGIFF